MVDLMMVQMELLIEVMVGVVVHHLLLIPLVVVMVEVALVIMVAEVASLVVIDQMQGIIITITSFKVVIMEVVVD